ncbi:triphosphoribosyl-dephospho-CoA synthase MdcB [Bartonella sp. HY406]|uniref:triphosphoribosyl-dephospho-CoA synthase MdcB n=1 Tax=Bartonella sp. HY406 TaxID=2979331 RepID=UPI0021C64161|nr:triphosphoribosyl-dephospho-CoA synthase MdcB [Bartonella sp. HY406]UXN03225.1 triphosphoribosyl-dephospho-CoA synthase MdcB [Bartonella sp. HY406]
MTYQLNKQSGQFNKQFGQLKNSLVFNDIGQQGDAIANKAYDALIKELQTYPKPGLVSHIDNGAHADMDYAILAKSAGAIRPFFKDLFIAGTKSAQMNELRCIGIAAEQAMIQVTNGINAHRGAIFALGLLCAAYGFKTQNFPLPIKLGTIIANQWGHDISHGPISLTSHGTKVLRLYGAGGAREEAARGYPSLYEIGLPALHEARKWTKVEEAQRIHVTMRLLAKICDTNLLHRGGIEGMTFAQHTAQKFIEDGSITQIDWQKKAAEIHDNFIKRNLSPGGVADMLAATVFLECLGDG